MITADTATVICTAWKPFERHTLKGFADLWLRAARLNIHGCAVHEKNGRRWVQLPAKPQLDAELVIDAEGLYPRLTLMRSTTSLPFG